VVGGVWCWGGGGGGRALARTLPMWATDVNICFFLLLVKAIVSFSEFQTGHNTRHYNWLRLAVNVKWSRYRPGVAQRVGRGIVALLFHDRGTRRGWVVSSTPRPHFTPGKDPVPILQEAGWAPGPVWTGRKSRPHWHSIPDRPARSSVTIPTELPDPHHQQCWA